MTVEMPDVKLKYKIGFPVKFQTQVRMKCVFDEYTESYWFYASFPILKTFGIGICSKEMDEEHITKAINALKKLLETNNVMEVQLEVE